jgi:hypothetical protein
MEVPGLKFKPSASRTQTHLCHGHTHRFSSSKWARIFSSSPLLSVAMLHGACCPNAASLSVMGLECRNRYWSSSLHGCGEKKGGSQVLDRETAPSSDHRRCVLKDSLLSHIQRKMPQVQAWEGCKCSKVVVAVVWDTERFPGCWGFWVL